MTQTNGTADASSDAGNPASIERELQLALVRSRLIAEGVAQVALRLLRTTDPGLEIPAALRILGESVSASRAYVFENSLVEGALVDTLRFEWDAPRIPSASTDGTDVDPAYSPDYERYVRVLGTGGSIAERTRDAPVSERASLEADGVLSYALVPIFAGGGWWGYMGFDDCQTEREWSDEEVGALRTAADCVGAALERQQLDEQLHAEEAKFRTLVEQTPGVIYIEGMPAGVEESGPVLYVSPQLEEMLGYTGQQWVDDPYMWDELIHDDDWEGMAKGYDYALATGTPLRMEYRVRAADGRWVWIQDDSRVVKGAAGAPLFWQGVMRDITDEKLAEGLLRSAEEQHRAAVESLREAEARFRTLVEGGTAAVYIDEPGEPWTTVYVSPQIEAILGCTPEDYIEKQDLWLRSIHPEDRERILALEEETDASGEPFIAEYRIVNHRGETRWVHEQARMVRDADGSPVNWLGVWLDVTRQKEAEGEAREAEDRFRVLVESTPAVTWIDNASEPFDTIYVSPQVETVLGITQKEITQQSLEAWFERVHPDDRERVIAATWAADESGKRHSIEYRMINARGEEVWVHDEAQLIRNPDGSRRYWLGVTLNVTETKRVEELRRDLELEQATSAKLRELDRAKDNLLEVVSHDFRTPLASILGFGLTLERSLSALTEEDAVDFAQRIVANAWKLDHLVNDVLDVTRLEDGELKTRKQPTDIGELIRRLLSDTAVGGGAKIDVEVESVVVEVDPPLIERIADNLVSNALRHNAVGVSVHVRVLPVPGGAEVWVADDGKGVPPDFHDELFDRFSMGRGSRGDPSPGLGLGLSIVRRITELHGGRVWYEDTEGGGATFKVFLPTEAPEPDPVS